MGVNILENIKTIQIVWNEIISDQQHDQKFKHQPAITCSKLTIETL